MSVVVAIPAAVVVAVVVAVVDAVVVASKRLAHSFAHAIPQARPAHAVPIRASMSVEARSRSRSRGNKYKGIIVEWRGDKGLGFVQGDESSVFQCIPVYSSLCRRRRGTGVPLSCFRGGVRSFRAPRAVVVVLVVLAVLSALAVLVVPVVLYRSCLLYTSDAADE